MPLFVLAIAAFAGWTIWRDRDKARRRRNLALMLALAGGFLLLKGNWILALLLGGGAAWVMAQGRINWPRRRLGALSHDFGARLAEAHLAEARALLGVASGAGVDEINAAYRRLIARNHPDAGGTEELASRINAARNLLLADKDGF
jgi:DnaJ homolog subfamily C member 19